MYTSSKQRAWNHPPSECCWCHAFLWVTEISPPRGESMTAIKNDRKCASHSQVPEQRYSSLSRKQEKYLSNSSIWASLVVQLLRICLPVQGTGVWSLVLELRTSLVAQMVKHVAYNAGDLGSIPGSGRSSGEGNGNPLQYSCLEKSHGQRSMVGYSPLGCKELDITEQIHFTSLLKLRSHMPQSN